jgi:RimJ/RimL family protein N-acetyltransferase
VELAPVVLAGQHVRLEPVSARHVPGLWAVAQEPAIWRWIPHPYRLDSESAVRALVARSEQSLANRTGVTFAQVDPASGEVMGSSSYLAADPQHLRIEIGATWLHPRFQRSGANTEAKRLLLGHAFERLGCRRVEFKTDAENRASRAALARIGAREEGTFRAHMVRPDGSRRDSVYFSVLDGEWPEVRAHLDALLRPPAAGSHLR